MNLLLSKPATVEENNMENIKSTISSLLKEHSLKDILDSLYEQIDNLTALAQKSGQDYSLELSALDVACEMLEENLDDDTFYLIY